MKRTLAYLLFLLLSFNLSAQLHRKPFTHPGMLQSREDMEYMKQQILSGEQPWAAAFENLKTETLLDFTPQPFTHVSMGAYGVNNSGSREFDTDGKAACNHALMGYITGDKANTDKAIEIINAWSYRLWDFDANNAKLTVGLSAPYFLNAAEILKHTNSGWAKKDQEQFSRLVLTVLYPTIQDFFPEANGNWDASMIYTMLCMGIYLDNYELFDRAVDRFHRGIGHSGITKYIYPTGQCQETTRDWDHVQLGLGEFAKAAQVAWTQGVDFYSVAGNRLGLGIEYTARFLSGEAVPVFGMGSQREKDHRCDIYESVYYHYTTVKGIEMPYTRQIIEKATRPQSSTGILTACRAPQTNTLPAEQLTLLPDPKAKLPEATGALKQPTVTPPNDAIFVKPGKSIQKAIDSHPGKWIVLAKGVHVLKQALRLESHTTLSGQGKETILMLSPEIEDETIVNASKYMHDVTIRDLLIEGAKENAPYFDPQYERQKRAYTQAKSRGGILFSADYDNQMKNIRLENLTVQGCTKSGVSIRGAAGVKVLNCDFSDNGGSVVPGAGFHHNLHLTHLSDSEIANSRFDDSLFGSGIDLSFGNNVAIVANEAARNKLSGIRCTENKDIRLQNNLTEGNDAHEIAFERLIAGFTSGIFGNHAMHPCRQIEFVKQQIKAANEPYFSAYRQLIQYADSIRNVSHHALVDFSVPGFYIQPDEHRNNSLAIQYDAFGAYCSALAYVLSGEKKYGDKAAYFLNAWSSVNKKYSEHDGVLVMTYSGAGFLMAAELMSDTEIWTNEDSKAFEKWVRQVYQKAANEIRVHKNNWADWGRFGSLLAASFLDDKNEITENRRLIQSDLFEKISPDGSMPEETHRGNNGIWYTYFSLAPMTAAAWLVYNLTGEDLFNLEQEGVSMKKALDYLAYYNQHPAEWPWCENSNTGAGDMWPENLLEAMAGIYQDANYVEYVKSSQPVIYPKHHFAWVFPTLMPLLLK
ncbi:MAG: hypothetical protein EZS26_002250 [Candidatus Ordinivivax streblomastigis]|uniref:Alginate lyase domain-containing protein n=1 Tax=Candidatus Ordinivivax streblomastigis TaxID=2540710 RepID=A0A5M8NZR8_9BACT|nr:MAG: hypothetical protein EZS26_002250 [Candidatus Ordinivivax streblomastigis]